jgi:hypothetical protein
MTTKKLSPAAQKSLKAADLAVDPIKPPLEEQTVTVGDIVALPKDDPELEGFAMSDEPFDPLLDVENVPEVLGPTGIDGSHGHGDYTAKGPPTSLPGYIAPTDNVTYESRIRILEAFRYPGSFRNAPDWIDRNWLGHGDWDPLRQIEPGPALRVPVDSGVVLARIGDYVVKQAVAIAPGVPDEVKLEVWPAETFQKLFLPKAKSSQPPTLELSSTPSA